jgi:hypothetical protein
VVDREAKLVVVNVAKSSGTERRNFPDFSPGDVSEFIIIRTVSQMRRPCYESLARRSLLEFLW